MASSTANASPRLYARHQRHARLARTRRSGQKLRFLSVEATRLFTTKTAIFNFLYANHADTIEVAANTGVLLPDNRPFTGN